MKLMLLIGGIAFLLLGLLLLLAAIVVFVMARKRGAKQSAPPQRAVPQATGPAVLPSAGVPPPPPHQSFADQSAAPHTPPAESFAARPEVPRSSSQSFSVQPETAHTPSTQSFAVQPEIPHPASTQAIPLVDPQLVAGGTIAVSMPEREEWGALSATTGPIAGRTFPITRDGFFIGRDASAAQVVIQDGSVSKRHVWIGVREGEVVAIDDGSTNGTYLNVVGTRIGRQRLNPGDTLIISNDVTRLVYQR